MNKLVVAIVLVVTPLAYYCKTQSTKLETTSNAEALSVIGSKNRSIEPSHESTAQRIEDSKPDVRESLADRESVRALRPLLDENETSSNHSNRSDRLNELLKDSRKSGVFVTPRKEDVIRFEELLIATIENHEPVDELTKRWAFDGWKFEQWSANERKYLAVYEAPGRLHGRGFFAFQIGDRSNVVLQAPHRFYDQGTGSIVQKVFSEFDCYAAAWNTVHRKEYDLAHRENHFINAFTRAVIKCRADAMIVQVHGFANEKQNGSAATAKVIISDTTKFPGRIARRSAANLKQAFGKEEIRLFPIEVRQLGGTKNVQADVVLGAGSSNFLHVELNRDFRSELNRSEKMRSDFMNSLALPQ